MKSCELCKSMARIYCESDQASLCWDCDAKVHSANFLVARHSRSLLCQDCQSPTAWNASGEKLGPTVSVCERCVDGSDGMKVGDDDGGGAEEESEGGNDDEIDTEDEYDDDDDDDDDDDLDEDNQVVPWSSTPPPPAASSSSSEESSSSGDGEVSLKRMRQNVADLSSDNDLDCSSSQRNNCTSSTAATTTTTRTTTLSGRSGEGAYVESLTVRPLKTRRIESNQSTRVQHGQAGERSAAIVESLERFHQQQGMTSVNNAPAAIGGACRRSKNRRAVDFDSSDSPP